MGPSKVFSPPRGSQTTQKAETRLISSDEGSEVESTEARNSFNILRWKLAELTREKETTQLGCYGGCTSKKARTKVDAIQRMARSLDSENMLTTYSAFVVVRPILEYGSTLFMGTKPTHLEKLDRVQATFMERIGGFKAEPLAALREAALIALTLKQLDGDRREVNFVRNLRTYTAQCRTLGQ